MTSHLDPLWLQKDLDRYHSDEKASYGAVSLAEECSGMELERVWKPLPELSYSGPPDWLNPNNGAHQRQNRSRDQREWFVKEFAKIQAETPRF